MALIKGRVEDLSYIALMPESVGEACFSLPNTRLPVSQTPQRLDLICYTKGGGQTIVCEKHIWKMPTGHYKERS